MNDGSGTAPQGGASPESLAADIRATRRERAATVEALETARASVCSLAGRA